MAEPYEVEAGFPLSGLSEVTPFADQEEGTSADMLNVFPFGADGRLRGQRRPGIDKFCSAQVGGASNKIQGIGHITATKVDTVLGAKQVFIKGQLGATAGYGLLASSNGAETNLAATGAAFGAIFGPDDNVYVVDASGSNVRLIKYAVAGGAAEFTTTMFTDSNTPAEKKLLGLAIDEDTVFVWYSAIDTIGEGVMRFDFSGNNRDSSTNGVFLRAESDATSIERAFGGASGSGWDVLPTASHSGMKLYQGKLAMFGAPLKDGGTASEHELVLYIVDLKTGIIDATHDLGVDGTSSSDNKAVAIDIEFGLDGFIYVLYKDDDTVGSDDIYLIRKVDVGGNPIWEISIDNSELTNDADVKSICWNPDRAMLVACGTNLFGQTGISMAVIEPDSKGIVDYAQIDSITDWECVRCDLDGNYYLWSSGSTKCVAFDEDFAQVWDVTTSANSQNRVAVNQFWNSGADEQGSTRYQETICVSNGSVYKLTSSTATAITGGSSVLSTTADTIYTTNFGVLMFFADGANAYYYDPSEGASGTVIDWASKVDTGILPNDTNGGFPYIETWNRRIVIFGLEDDPSNWYMSAKNNPFDWKQQSNVIDAAISGRTSPAGLYPGRLYGVIPYNDDLAIFAGDHTMYQLSGDPAVDGKFDLITDTVGIAPGRAWCKDGFGSVYFFGNNGGIYKMSLNSPPQRISNRSIDKRFENVNLPNSLVRLVWDSLLQGIHVFITPTDGTTNATQYFFDFRTEGWFPYQFALTAHQPYSVAVVDLDEPQDQNILIGGKDGYVRKFNDAVNTDDGSIYDGHFVLGPWISREGSKHQLMMYRMDMVVGAGSSLDCEVLSGVDAEAVIANGRSIYETPLNELKSNIHHPRASGRALAVKIKSEDTVARGMNFESFRAQMADVRHL